MSVREFLESHTSRDLAELRAYEMRNGPIGPQYIHEALAMIHEQLQALGRMVLAAGGAEEHQLPDVIHYPRPPEAMGYEPHEVGDDEEE